MFLWVLGVTVECTLLINTIPTFIPNSQSHFDLPPEPPSFLRNPDLFPSRHVASRCSCPPSSQLPCSSALSPILLSLSDNIYVGWRLAQGSHKCGICTNTMAARWADVLTFTHWFSFVGTHNDSCFRGHCAGLSLWGWWHAPVQCYLNPATH